MILRTVENNDIVMLSSLLGSGTNKNTTDIIKLKVENTLIPFVTGSATKVKTENNQTAWVCTICGYVYYGEELPDDFKCPLCGVGKEFFEKKA